MTLNPSLPTAGDLVTATIVVRNQGEGPAEDAGLVDEVSRSAAVRSASGPRGGTCDVSSRRAACELGTIEPGRSVTATVRFLLAREPASSTLTQRITLTGSGDAAVAERGVSTLIDQEQAGAVPFDSLGTPVLLVAVVAFVLAARGRSG